MNQNPTEIKNYDLIQAFSKQIENNKGHEKDKQQTHFL